MGGKTKDVASKKTPKQSIPPKFVAPDGGWGWVIVCASAMSNVIVIPIMQSFGLIFKDKFIDLGMTATDCSIIINVNSAFGMGLGLINGALLRRFTFRKVAVAGSLLVFIGVFGLTWANSFAHFLILYGFVTSIGTILVLISFSLALNTYFKVRRGRAAGLSLTFTGLGPIVIPLVISMLLDYYGVQGTVLILSGLSLHSFVAALLLQPVEWHIKPVKETPPIIEDEVEDNDELLDLMDEDQEPKKARRRYLSITSNSIDLDIDTKSMYGFETPMIEKRRSSITSEYQRGRPSTLSRSISQNQDGCNGGSRLPEASALLELDVDAVHLGSGAKIVDDNTHIALPNGDATEKELNKRDGKKDSRITFHENVDKLQVEGKPDADLECDDGSSESEEAEKACGKGIGRRLVVFFDLDLLSDPHYVSLMIGMSIAACAEINFSLFTPFIMSDMGFETSQVAAIMSTIASADIIFRFLAPYIGDALKLSSQLMYIIGLVMLIIARTTLIFFSTFQSVLVVSVMLGIAKGVRTVYMTLVIPAYVPLDRLAAASGIQMVTNGIFIMACGPVLGIIRDWTGSYNKSILAINGLTLFTVCMWSIELIIVRYRKRNT